MVSDRERIAHVVRRLGIGANPDLVAGLESVDDAVAAMLDLSAEPAAPPVLDPPPTWDDIDYGVLEDRLLPWWFAQLGSGYQPLVERLTWFLHDHFAVSADKVDHPYLMWQHHRLVRAGATGSFADLLHAVGTDPAMLWYLDGASNSVDSPNENFGREVMELHTVGAGGYRQEDVREIARAVTGWVVNEPDEDGRLWYDADPWGGVFDPELFDDGTKTVLGRSGEFGMTEALDLLLERPETAERVATALHRELVGLDPEPAEARRLGRRFAADWSLVGLVEAVVSGPRFLSDEAVRSRIRTPLEKAATLLQAFPRGDELAVTDLTWVLGTLHYLPLHPPNPAGFPAGHALLDPGRLLGSFTLLGLVANLDESDTDVDVPERLGLVDLSDATRDLLDRFDRPGLRLGLAFGSPEFLAT
jgi:uncharacterized protein (DUF1800 family)